MTKKIVFGEKKSVFFSLKITQPLVPKESSKLSSPTFCFAKQMLAKKNHANSPGKKKNIFGPQNWHFLTIFVRFGIGATISIGREIQCLTYAFFYVQQDPVATKKCLS